jgi:hypothetical protein
MKGRSGILAMYLAMVMLALLPAGLFAQETEFTVTADSMKTLADGTVTATGGVEVRSGNVVLHASEMRYDPATYTLKLFGGVSMEDDSGRSFKGDILTLDVRDMTGGVREGEIRVGTTGLTIRGETIERVGEDEFRTRRGVITSCSGDCPDWSFAASDIHVRKEGYLVAKHAAFRICNVPVFYTPYLIYPVMTRRQTGLLMPEFSFTEEDGLETALPFYLVLGDHADATLTTHAFSRDTTGLGAEFRYRLHHGGSGNWNGFAMSGEGDRRWYWSGEHASRVMDDVWLRGRWADTGDPLSPARFGDNFEERNPGAVYRHLTLEAAKPNFRVWAGTKNLVADAAQASTDDPANFLKTETAGVDAGPYNILGASLGASIDLTSFEEEGQRTLFMPWLEIPIEGPWPLVGRAWFRHYQSLGGEGSTDDSGVVAGISERLKIAADRSWGRHTIDIDLAYSYSQKAVFTDGVNRDAGDAMEKRYLLTGKARSMIKAGKLVWNLEAGFWQDAELEESRGYGETHLDYKGFYLEGSRNQDAGLGLVLPSLSTQESSPRGWDAELGYRSDPAAISFGRESSEGSPDIFSVSGRAGMGPVLLSGSASYDQDARAVSDETITLVYNRQCWNLALSRSRTPDRTDWKVKVELEI